MPVRDRSAPMLLVKLQTTKRDDFRVVTDDVLSFQYTDAERKADKALLTVNNSDLSNFDDPVWRKGSRLIFQWGYPGAMTPARTAIITSVKGFKELQIEANAESVLMNRTTRSRCFDGQKISDIASSIATEYGFGVDQQHIDDSGDVLEVVPQANRTDAQFLRRWASRLGYEFYVDFDGFHFHERRLGSRPVRVLRYHIDQGGGDILGEPNIDNDITARPGRVRVKGRDPKTRQDIDAVADNESDTDRDTLGPNLELTIDRDTGSISHRIVPEERVGADEVVNTADPNAAQAVKRAKGRFRRAQQVAVKMNMSIVGDPLMLAKSVVQVEGMGKRLSIRYYVEEVVHNLSISGYTCNLKLVSDGHGGHSTESRRVRGFDAFQVSHGGKGKGKKKQDDVLAKLRDGVTAAKLAGDDDAAREFENALTDYKQGNTDAVSSRLKGLVQKGNQSATGKGIVDAANAASTSIAQSAAEPETNGKLNKQEAHTDDDALGFELGIDADSGKLTTSYKQTRR